MASAFLSLLYRTLTLSAVQITVVTWENNTASAFLSLLYPHRRLTLYKSPNTIMSGKEYFVFV